MALISRHLAAVLFVLCCYKPESAAGILKDISDTEQSARVFDTASLVGSCFGCVVVCGADFTARGTAVHICRLLFEVGGRESRHITLFTKMELFPRYCG